MIRRGRFTGVLDAFLIASLITAIAATGWFDEIDYNASDRFYQQSGVRNPNIAVIGIDLITLNKLGALSSIPRGVYAQAIENLNRDPEARPVVIGMDMQFVGEKLNDPEGDRILVDAAAQCGNVVVASQIAVDDEKALDTPYSPWDQTWHWISPYPALNAVVESGHIDAPDEPDGITRHELLYVNTVERGRLYSFSRVIYEKYCRAKGIDPKAPTTTEGNGLYYLPFTAKSYFVGSFVDLVEGKLDPSTYRDKIVLIGIYAPGLQDSEPTALDRTDLMYGVDIHANAIEAFQKGFFPREFERTPQLILLFVLSFAAEFFIGNAKMQSMALIWLAGTVGWLVLCHVCYRQEIILHVAWVPIAASMIFVIAVATNYMRACAERDQVTATFGRYVDPTIMTKLLEGAPNALDVGGKCCSSTFEASRR